MTPIDATSLTYPVGRRRHHATDRGRQRQSFFVPKKRVVGQLQFDGTGHRLATWQVAGLTLAAISVAAFTGLGAPVGVLPLAPVLSA